MSAKDTISETFHPRGIGANWLRCFLCGGPEGLAIDPDGAHFANHGKLQADMASFVDGHAGGLRVQAMLVEAGLHSFLDFRPSEPNWVQLKLGACPKHEANLERLGKLTSEAGGQITPEIIQQAIAEER